MYSTLELQDVKDRSDQLGFALTSADDRLIEFQIKKTVKYALAQINQYSIPDQLYEALIDMVVGEILNLKYATGQLDLGALDLTPVIQRIKDGDTDVSYAASLTVSPEISFKKLIDNLINEDYDWQQWRKLRWC